MGISCGGQQLYDDTAEVVRRFAETSSFPTRYFFEIKQGLSYARNAGIRAARGEIIAFTDDDVEVDPHWLSELQEPLTSSNALASAGESLRCGPVGSRLG